MYAIFVVYESEYRPILASDFINIREMLNQNFCTRSFKYRCFYTGVFEIPVFFLFWKNNKIGPASHFFFEKQIWILKKTLMFLLFYVFFRKICNCFFVECSKQFAICIFFDFVLLFTYILVSELCPKSFNKFSMKKKVKKM